MSWLYMCKITKSYALRASFFDQKSKWVHAPGESIFLFFKVSGTTYWSRTFDFQNVIFLNRKTMLTFWSKNSQFLYKYVNSSNLFHSEFNFKLRFRFFEKFYIDYELLKLFKKFFFAVSQPIIRKNNQKNWKKTLQW